MWTAGADGGKKTCELTKECWDLLRFWEARFREEQQGLARFFERFGPAQREHEHAP